MIERSYEKGVNPRICNYANKKAIFCRLTNAYIDWYKTKKKRDKSLTEMGVSLRITSNPAIEGISDVLGFIVEDKNITNYIEEMVDNGEEHGIILYNADTIIICKTAEELFDFFYHI